MDVGEIDRAIADIWSLAEHLGQVSAFLFPEREDTDFEGDSDSLCPTFEDSPCTGIAVPVRGDGRCAPCSLAVATCGWDSSAIADVIINTSDELKKCQHGIAILFTATAMCNLIERGFERGGTPQYAEVPPEVGVLVTLCTVMDAICRQSSSADAATEAVYTISAKLDDVARRVGSPSGGAIEQAKALLDTKSHQLVKSLSILTEALGKAPPIYTTGFGPSGMVPAVEVEATSVEKAVDQLAVMFTPPTELGASTDGDIEMLAAGMIRCAGVPCVYIDESNGSGRLISNKKEAAQPVPFDTTQGPISPMVISFKNEHFTPCIYSEKPVTTVTPQAKRTGPIVAGIAGTEMMSGPIQGSFAPAQTTPVRSTPEQAAPGQSKPVPMSDSDDISWYNQSFGAPEGEQGSHLGPTSGERTPDVGDSVDLVDIDEKPGEGPGNKDGDSVDEDGDGVDERGIDGNEHDNGSVPDDSSNVSSAVGERGTGPRKDAPVGQKGKILDQGWVFPKIPKTNPFVLAAVLGSLVLVGTALTGGGTASTSTRTGPFVDPSMPILTSHTLSCTKPLCSLDESLDEFVAASRDKPEEMKASLQTLPLTELGGTPSPMGPEQYFPVVDNGRVHYLGEREIEKDLGEPLGSHRGEMYNEVEANRDVTDPTDHEVGTLSRAAHIDELLDAGVLLPEYYDEARSARDPTLSLSGIPVALMSMILTGQISDDTPSCDITRTIGEMIPNGSSPAQLAKEARRLALRAARTSATPSSSKERAAMLLSDWLAARDLYRRAARGCTDVDSLVEVHLPALRFSDSKPSETPREFARDFVSTHLAPSSVSREIMARSGTVNQEGGSTLVEESCNPSFLPLLQIMNSDHPERIYRLSVTPLTAEAVARMTSQVPDKP